MQQVLVNNVGKWFINNDTINTGVGFPCVVFLMKLNCCDQGGDLVTTEAETGLVFLKLI